MSSPPVHWASTFSACVPARGLYASIAGSVPGFSCVLYPCQAAPSGVLASWSYRFPVCPKSCVICSSGAASSGASTYPRGFPSCLSIAFDRSIPFGQPCPYSQENMSAASNPPSSIWTAIRW